MNLSLISSLVALTISVVTGLYNLIGYFEKPRPTLLEPEQVTIYASYSGDWPYVTMVTNFNIFNDSRPERYGLIIGERLEFVVDNLPRVLRWQQVGRWANGSFSASGPAQPFAVPGGSVTAQEVSFAPRSKLKADLKPGESEGDNWVDWEACVKELKRGNLKVRCVVELYGGGVLTSDVEVIVTPGVLQALQNSEPGHRWAPARCRKF